jgi:hypothetical protein
VRGRLGDRLVQHLIEGPAPGRDVRRRLADAEERLRPDVCAQDLAQPLPCLAYLHRLGEQADHLVQTGRLQPEPLQGFPGAQPVERVVGARADHQQALVEADATQCGFCTPGFAMAMFAFVIVFGIVNLWLLVRGLTFKR